MKFSPFYNIVYLFQNILRLCFCVLKKFLINFDVKLYYLLKFNVFVIFSGYDATESQIQQQFLATHPFVFFVIDTETKVALVAGTMVDPSLRAMSN